MHYVRMTPLNLPLCSATVDMIYSTVPGVKVHQLDSLIIAAGGDEVSSRTPGQAVDRALVVLRPLE